MAIQKKILITGGAGNIGSSLASKLLVNPSNYVVVVDNLSTGSRSKLPAATLSNFQFIKADANQFNELASIMLSYQFDYVFHYAAVVGVSRTLENPVMVLKDIEGIRNVLDLSKNTGVKRVFYSSSSEVYGEPVTIPQYEETTPLNSRLPYAVVKNVGEAFCRSYYQEFGLPYSVFRFFNTYGPGQSEDFVVPRFLRAAMQAEPIHIYGDGSQTRTFCYVDDNIEATMAIMDDPSSLNQTVNIGSDEELSILELAKLVKQVSGSTSPIVHLPPLKEGDMARRKPDISRMKNYLAKPLITLAQGIALLHQSYLKEK